MKKILLNISILGLIVLSSCSKIEKTDTYNPNSITKDLQELVSTQQITKAEQQKILYYLSLNSTKKKDLSNITFEELIKNAEEYEANKKKLEEKIENENRKEKTRIMSRSF